MKKRASAIALALALIASACVYDWELAPTDAGAPDAAEADANSPSTTPDANAPDVGVFSCDGAFLCDDFEQGALNKQWTKSYVGDGGALTFGSAPGTANGTKILIAAREAKPAEVLTSAWAWTTHPTAVAMGHVSLAFRIRPVTIATVGTVCVAGIVFNDESGKDHVVRLLIGKNRAEVQEKTAPGNTPYTTHPASGAPQVGEWSSVRFEVLADKKVALWLNGTNVMQTSETLDTSWTASTNTKIFAGIQFVSADNLEATTIQFDDVRASAE
jgi:hypothetical protein